MRALRSRFCALALVLCSGPGCGSKPQNATRADCEKIAEHIAEMIVADAVAKPDTLWDVVSSGSGDTGIPKEVDKAGFATWLASPEGKTWMMQRKGQTMSGTQQAIEPCVKKAAPRSWVNCMLATKSKADVEACDATVAK